jgi:hypothetical protein
MTRSFASYRKSTRRAVRKPRPARDPSVETLGFTCFRLVPIRDPGPDEGPFETIQLTATSNAMGAFVGRHL